MTNDNNIESKYVGTHPEQWEISIQSLQNVHTEVLPSCLVKGNQQQWISVREDFPEVDYDQESFKKGQDAIDFIETEIDLISLDEAVGTRDELTCISIYQSCKKFFEIMATELSSFHRSKLFAALDSAAVHVRYHFLIYKLYTL